MTATPAAVALAVCAGITGGIQIALNGILGRRIGVVEASAFATVLTMVIVNGFMLATRQGVGGFAAALREPWWLWLGGLMSAILILSLTFAAPRIGTMATVGIMIAGQLAVAIAIDTFALLGFERVPFTLPRALGLVLLALGAWLALQRP
jgi:bacterial/archaeal transporter family-2 protein